MWEPDRKRTWRTSPEEGTRQCSRATSTSSTDLLVNNAVYSSEITDVSEEHVTFVFRVEV
jgi:hypothetical protein